MTIRISGNDQEQAQLTDSLQRLEKTGIGRAIAQAIRDRGTTVQFGPTEEGTIAQFNLATNVITLGDQLKEASPNVLAAHLAHEGTHVQWGTARSSIGEEYAAFKAQAEVWNELKGNEMDEMCGKVSVIIDMGEVEARRRIQRVYWWLSE